MKNNVDKNLYYGEYGRSYGQIIIIDWEVGM